MIDGKHTAVIKAESAPFIVNHRQHIVITVGNIGQIPIPSIGWIIFVDGIQIIDDGGEIGIRSGGIEEIDESVIVVVFIFPGDGVRQVSGCAGFRRSQNGDCRLSIQHFQSHRNIHRRINRVVGFHNQIDIINTHIQSGGVEMQGYIFSSAAGDCAAGRANCQPSITRVRNIEFQIKISRITNRQDVIIGLTCD